MQPHTSYWPHFIMNADMIFSDCCRYVKSRSDKQLRREAAEGDTTNCYPEDKTKDNKPIVPCGLIAWSLFNDTYRFSMNNKDLTVNKKDIAWKSDRTSKFGSKVYPKNFQSGNMVGGAKLNESIPVNIYFFILLYFIFFFFCFFFFFFGLCTCVLRNNLCLVCHACTIVE